MGKTTYGNKNQSNRIVYKGRIALQYTAHALIDTEVLAVDGAGMYTLSGSGGAITVNLPNVDECIGSEFIFRSLSPHAHVISGSGTKANDDANTLVSGITQGTDGALDAVIGSSVVLRSDGLHFLVLQSSGSFTVT